MATEELNVKLKVDSKGVTAGLDEAKKDVKKQTDEMSNDVQRSSQKMEESFKDVGKSAENIGESTKTATNAVKDMEKQVQASSKNMEQSLDSVSKKMNLMAIARGGQRLGGIAQTIIGAVGGEGEGAQLTSSLIGGVTTGAAQGAMFGPIGMAGGALLGASTELLKAGKELQDAAKSQDEKAKSDLETQRREILHNENVKKWTAEAKGMAEEAYGNSYMNGTDEGREALGANISEQRKRIAELTAQRDEIAKNYDEDGDIFAQAERMRALNDAIAFATEKLNIFQQAANEAAEADRIKQEKEEASIRAIEESIEARKKEAQAIRRKAEEEEARERAKAEAEAAREAERAAREEQKRQIADTKGELKEGEGALAALQRQLEGVGKNDTPTDQLTKMGGGVGYSSYNHSVEQVEKQISDNLKQLIQNQQNQNQDIITKLDDLINKPASDATWQAP